MLRCKECDVVDLEDAHTVVTLNPDGSIEWIYGTYSTENKAKKVVDMLKTDGRKAKVIFGRLL